MDEVAALREQLETTLATLEQSMEGLADAAPGAKKEEGGRRQTIKKKPPSRTESLASSAATAGGRPRPLGRQNTGTLRKGGSIPNFGVAEASSATLAALFANFDSPARCEEGRSQHVTYGRLHPLHLDRRRSPRARQD